VPEGLTAVIEEPGSDIFVIPKRQTDTGRLRQEQRKRQAGHLLATMDRAYNEDELRELCMSWDIDYESISGGNKRAKIMSVIGHFYRHNTIQIFVEFFEVDRPKRKWRPDEPPKETS